MCQTDQYVCPNGVSTALRSRGQFFCVFVAAATWAPALPRRAHPAGSCSAESMVLEAKLLSPSLAKKRSGKVQMCQFPVVIYTCEQNLQINKEMGRARCVSSHLRYISANQMTRYPSGAKRKTPSNITPASHCQRLGSQRATTSGCAAAEGHCKRRRMARAFSL